MKASRILAVLMFLLPTFSTTVVDAGETTLQPPTGAMAHFAWGADIGGSVDMSGHDMSTLDISAHFGYKNSIIHLLGIGANLNMMVSNSCRAYPVYGIIRTSFTKRPTLCFMEARAGAAINCLENNISQTGLYLSGGIGINLATGSTFRSHMVLSYSFFDRGYATYRGEDFSVPDLHYVSVRIGISF